MWLEGYTSELYEVIEMFCLDGGYVSVISNLKDLNLTICLLYINCNYKNCMEKQVNQVDLF